MNHSTKTLFLVLDLERGFVQDKVVLDSTNYSDIDEYNRTIIGEDRRLEQLYPLPRYSIAHLCGGTEEEILEVYPEYRRYMQ
jgi:hypothetical protein